MAHFSYTAHRNDGETYHGVAEAADRFEVYNIIRREGGHLLSLEETESTNIFSVSYWQMRVGGVKEYDKILLLRNLGSMISAGLPLARALAVIERQSKSKRLSHIVAVVASEVRHGHTLHEALDKFPNIFSRLLIAMIRAGEESGDLSGALLLTSEQMERMFDLKKKIRGAMIYPAIILTVIAGVGVLMMIKVVPTLAQTFAEMGADLPGSTKFVIGLSNFLMSHTIVALLSLVGGIAGIYLMLRTAVGQRVADFILLRLPVIGTMVREVNAARVSRTLASLSSSGVDVLTGLEITHEVIQNSYFQRVVALAQEAVGQGEPLSSVFLKHTELFPPFVGEMMSVGEETGQTADMLKRLAIYYESEVDRKTKDMSTIIEPFLMVFIGGAVGFFAISMISPIYQLSEHI